MKARKTPSNLKVVVGEGGRSVVVPCHPTKTPTALEFYESVEDKESDYWKMSGRHTYGVLLKFEEKERILCESKKKKVSEDTLLKRRKFEEWSK